MGLSCWTWTHGTSPGTTPAQDSRRPDARRRPGALGRSAPWLQGLIGLAQSGRTATRGPVRRGDVRAAILDVLSVRADERLPDHPADRRAQRRLEAEPRLGLPDGPALEDEGSSRAARATAPAAQPDRPAGPTSRTPRRDRRHLAPSTPAAAQASDLKPVIGQVMGAVWQVVTTGTSQRAEAAEILAGTWSGMAAPPREGTVISLIDRIGQCSVGDDERNGPAPRSAKRMPPGGSRVRVRRAGRGLGEDAAVPPLAAFRDLPQVPSASSARHPGAVAAWAGLRARLLSRSAWGCPGRPA